MVKRKDNMNKAENKMHEIKGRTKQKAKDIKKKISRDDDNTMS